MVMVEATQQAFMTSGHQKDKIRDINEEWGLKKAMYTTIAEEYQAFKIFHTRKLRTMYSDSHKRHMAKHTDVG